ncbi:MAG: VWA domain-containing protein [Pseudomonadota bacterium]
MNINFANKIFPISLVALSCFGIGIYPYLNEAAATAEPSGITKEGEISERAPELAFRNEDESNIEVVFVLDTTSSMSGMIQAAKDNIWSIASTMASAESAPSIKMGLVAFRDRGDAYVTKVFDLSEDLDGMYTTLMDFKAQGGGDGPESVNQALHEAVTKISWSNNNSSYKVIFLVGDAPPHMDYQNDVQFPESVELATNKGIIVNTIQAGQDANTQRSWQKIASLSQGNYFNVNAEGSHVAVSTPFDSDIATLSEELDATRVFYGSEVDRAKNELKAAASKKLHAIASVASRAKRALFNTSASGEENFRGDKELIGAVSSGELSLEDVAEAELPAALRALPEAEREAEVMRQAEKRQKISEQIAELASQRDAYLADELANKADLHESLDHQIYETVAKQAMDKGLRYEGGPKY